MVDDRKGLPQSFSKMEYDINIFFNGRQPPFFLKWKPTSIFKKNGIQPQPLFKHGLNGRQPQTFLKMEDDLRLF